MSLRKARRQFESARSDLEAATSQVAKLQSDRVQHEVRVKELRGQLKQAALEDKTSFARIQQEMSAESGLLSAMGEIIAETEGDRTAAERRFQAARFEFYKAQEQEDRLSLQREIETFQERAVQLCREQLVPEILKLREAERQRSHLWHDEVVDAAERMPEHNGIVSFPNTRASLPQLLVQDLATTISKELLGAVQGRGR